MRDAIARLLELLPDLKLVGTAGDARSCVAGITAWRPDVLTLDVNIPGGGPDLAREVKAINPTMHVLVFSGRDEPTVRELAAGADQPVVKTGRLNPLLTALRRVGTGSSQLPTQRRPSPDRPPATGGAQSGFRPTTTPADQQFRVVTGRQVQ